MSALTQRPISFNAARAWISQVHRHLRRPITGWLFGCEVLHDGNRIGVAAAGRPPRMLQDGVTVEIVRVAVLEGHANACSFAYGRLRAAAVALGYQRVVTYTLPDESGSSLRAAGFTDDGVTDGGEWSRPSRPRRAVEQSCAKRRWIWPASARTGTKLRADAAAKESQ